MRSAALCWCGLALVRLGFPEKAQSQTQAGTGFGDRVRYWRVREDTAIPASLMRAAKDTFTFRLTSGAVIQVPRARITRLEVSAGRYRAALPGALAGLGGGILVGAIGGALYGHRGGTCQCVDTRTNMGVGAAFGGIVGLLGGATIGAPREDWRNVSLVSNAPLIVAAGEPRLRVSFVAAAESTTIGYLHSADSASVTLRSAATGDFTTLPRRSIRFTEVSAGTERHKLSGFVTGLFGGALLAGGIAGLSQRHSVGEDDLRGLAVVGAGAAGAVVGSVVGAVVGSHVSSESWKKFIVPPRVTADP